MRKGSEKIYFQEDLNFYLRKKIRKLGLGIVLIVIPPVALYFMFFRLLYWSSLFEKETGMILIFLVVSPFAGLFFTARALKMRRMRIFADKIPNPDLLGKWCIPISDIHSVIEVLDDSDVVKVEINLKKESKASWNKEIRLGEFLEKDVSDMKSAFIKLGVNTGLK